jgi:RNA polymerase sigma-70 factor (ECF subfamily)
MRPDDPEPETLADLAILGQVLEESRPRLRAMLERRIGPSLASRVCPDDVLNEAFLVARRRWLRFQENQAVSTYSWLYRIARDCLLEAWRRETRGGRDVRREMPWPEGSSLQLGFGLVSPGTDPGQAAQRQELKQRVQQMLDLLSETDREILWMRYFDGLTFPEVAEVLGIKESAATLRHLRALKRLRALWQQMFPQEGLDP